MKRDSTTISPWQSKSDFVSATQALNLTFFDVIIVGGGITGLSAALNLQKAGKKCLIAEAKTIAFGTSGGTTAHLNTMLDTSYEEIIKDFGIENAKLVYKVTKEAISLVENNIRLYNIDCDFERVNGYLYAEDDEQAEELDKILKSSKNAGVKIEVIHDVAINVPFKKALKFEEQAQMHPTKYLLSLAAEFENAGGVILQNCRVLNIDEQNDITVETTLGKYLCKDLIYATHLPPGINILHFECAPYRSYVISATLKDDAYPDGLIYDMQDPYHYYRTYKEGDKRYLILGGEDHKTGHEENTEVFFRNLEAYLNHYYHIDKIEYKWSSQYYEPADGLPYIGKNPGSGPNVYVATGFSGNGITLGTASAIVLSDLILSGSSEYENLFNPGRIKIAASFSNVVKENVDVIGHFIGDWLSIDKIPTLLEIAPEEAKIVRYDGKLAAIYKDEDSRIHAVNPACTHVKCSVLWNTSEKSWDCPCHGSRFSVDGEVLTGPARKDLETISLRH